MTMNLISMKNVGLEFKFPILLMMSQSFSTQVYEIFCLRLLDFVEAVAKTENQPILNEPVWSEIVENRERLRSRLQRGT